jgi:hypothetical protein
MGRRNELKLKYLREREEYTDLLEKTSLELESVYWAQHEN